MDVIRFLYMIFVLILSSIMKCQAAYCYYTGRYFYRSYYYCPYYHNYYYYYNYYYYDYYNYSGKLSGGAIVGIVVGSFVTLIILVIILVCWCEFGKSRCNKNATGVTNISIVPSSNTMTTQTNQQQPVNGNDNCPSAPPPYSSRGAQAPSANQTTTRGHASNPFAIDP